MCAASELSRPLAETSRRRLGQGEEEAKRELGSEGEGRISAAAAGDSEEDWDRLRRRRSKGGQLQGMRKATLSSASVSDSEEIGTRNRGRREAVGGGEGALGNEQNMAP
jgi:hypothetical protein